MREHKYGARFLAATILILASMATVADWPPPFMNYQGVLRDNAGNPLNGTYDMVFRFYTGGGDEILIDRHTTAQGGAIVASDGLFNVYLGGGVREDGSGPGTYTVLWDVFRDHQIVYVEVQIGADDDPDREVLSPRTRILAAAYAMNASSLAGLESSSLLRSDHDDFYTTGTLTFDAGTILDVNGSLNMDGAVTKATTDHVPNFNADLLDGLQATAFARPNLGNSWSGLNTFHRVPTGTALYGGSVVIDPASAGGNYTLFGIGVGTQERLRVDAEGDLVAKGSVNVSGTLPAFRIQSDVGANLSSIYSNDSQNYTYFHDAQNSRYMLYSNADGIGIGTNTVSSTFTTTTPSLWVSGTTLALNGRLDMDENGPDQNQNIYFYNNSSATSEYLRWDDAQDRFELSDQLAVYGPIRAGSYTAAPVNYHYFGTGGGPDSPTNITGWSDVYVEGDVEIDGSLLLNDNLYLHDGSATTPFWQYIHFWDSGSFSEHIVWNRYLVSQFQISDDLLVQGNLAATGTKPFVQNHPYDPDLSVYYVALEGDEAGTYTRGSGRLRDGEARIRLGETFSWVTNPEIGLTAHVTSRSPDAVVYVELVSVEELVVRNVSGFAVDAEFDYIVHGLRIGYEEFQSVQPRTTQAPVPSEAYYARQREEHPELQRQTAAARFAAMDRPGGRTAGLGSHAERTLRESIGEFDPDFEDPNREALAAAMQAEEARRRGSTPGVEPAEPGPAVSEAPPSSDAPPDSWALGIASVEESIPEEEIPEARNLCPLLTVSEEVEPGDLLTLDPSRPGSLIRAAIAQDPGVVGIVAGPTVTIDDEIRASVALSDLATVKADAGYGEIRAGDLLTSSFTTGHAMVALEIVPGTIIGKALEPLETGTGLIKVLVMPR